MSFVQDKTAYWIWTRQLYSYTGHFIQSLITNRKCCHCRFLPTNTGHLDFQSSCWLTSNLDKIYCSLLNHLHVYRFIYLLHPIRESHMYFFSRFPLLIHHFWWLGCCFCRWCSEVSVVYSVSNGWVVIAWGMTCWGYFYRMHGDPIGWQSSILFCHCFVNSFYLP
mgnify:CR=1 FL=1